MVCIAGNFLNFSFKGCWNDFSRFEKIFENQKCENEWGSLWCFSLQEGDGACRGSPEMTEVLTGTVTISKLAQVRGVVKRILLLPHPFPILYGVNVSSSPDSSLRQVVSICRGVACRTHVRRCFHIDLTI